MQSTNQSPRVAIHVKTDQNRQYTQAEDAGGDGGIPASHGRRLMQMIFRSNNASEPKEPMREAIVLTSPLAVHSDARSEDDIVVPVGSTKLSALKRKLFPSRKRRHPARIPPLVISPINAGLSEAEVGGSHPAEETGGPERNEEPSDEFENAVEHKDCQDPVIRDGDDGDIDDDLLDAIEEADRLQSTTSDETLAQMNRTIEELHKWKTQQASAVQSALENMEVKLANEMETLPPVVEDEASEQAMCEEAERKQRAAEAAREKLVVLLKETEVSIPAQRDDNDQLSRVLMEAEREAANDAAQETTSKAAALLKLREEVFDLGVKELSSKLQASWLGDLENADDDLNMQLYEVQTFASELDSVLAQFDAVGRGIDHPTEQNPAGQAAQEH